jgi:hypothetical protein
MTPPRAIKRANMAVTMERGVSPNTGVFGARGAASIEASLFSTVVTGTSLLTSSDACGNRRRAWETRVPNKPSVRRLVRMMANVSAKGVLFPPAGDGASNNINAKKVRRARAIV